MNTISNTVLRRPSFSASAMILWGGRILRALVILFFLFDCTVKLLQMPFAIEATVQLGYSGKILFTLGLIQLTCLVFYAIPRTAILGAILLTGYLGGAVATHVRAETEIFSIIFPILLGLMAWGGLFLNEERLRALIPLRS